MTKAKTGNRTAPDAPPLSGPVYRYALYGRAKSGKTCYLTALAMGRLRNPKGYNCDWLNTATHCPKPEGPEGAWDHSDPNVARYQGREWLKMAIEAVRSGAVPKSTVSTAPLRYLFEFRGADDYPGAPGLARTFTIELIDYSGELIDTDVSEESLARLVRKHMDECDGIIVLAEAPRPDSDWTVQYDELLKLRSAFNLVKRPPHGMPIALVINKWDRLGDEYDPRHINPEDPGQDTLDKRASKVLERFLAHKPEPPHVSLIDALKGKAGEGNFQIFTASALGSCQVVGEDERPLKSYPLQSYGLEDPFLWLARRGDELRVREVEEAASKLHPWSVWQVLAGTHVALSRKVRATEPYARQVAAWQRSLAEAAGKVRRTGLTQFFALASTTLLAGTLLAQYLVARSDRAAWFEIATLVRTTNGVPTRDPVALERYIESLKGHDLWLTRLQHGSFWRLGSRVAVPPGDVQSVLKDLRSRLQTCDKWLHELTSDAETVAYYRGVLDQIDRKISGANSPDQLGPPRQELAALGQNGDFLSRASVLGDEFSKVKIHLDSAEADLVDLRKAEEVEQKYSKLVADNDVTGVASLLSESSPGPKTSEVKSRLKKDFQSKAESMLRSAVEAEVRQGYHAAAANLLASRLRSPEVEAILGSDTCSRLRQMDAEWVWLPQDRSLYQAVRLNPTPETCGAYLEKSVRKEMEAPVRRYNEFLARKEKPADYQVKVSRINFGSPDLNTGWNGYHVKAVVIVGTEKLFETPPVEVRPGNWTSLSFSPSTLRGKQRDEVLTITVTMEATDTRQNWDLGKAQRQCTLAELSEKVALPLKSPHVKDGNKVELQVLGYEPEPVLPAYGSR